MTVYAYVILENHPHLIASADDLSKDIANFRSYTARQIIDTFKAKNAQHILKQLNTYKLRHKTDRDYQLWQEGTHPQLIQGEVMMRQKIEYIHMRSSHRGVQGLPCHKAEQALHSGYYYNPVKRGYVDEPAHWRYSSAQNYKGQKGLLEVQTEW